MYSSRFQGICPGNRLKIVPTSYDSGCFTPSPLSSPCPSSMSSTAGLLYSNGSTGSSSGAMSTSFVPHPNDLYENTAQKHSKRRSWHIMPNKVSASLIVARATSLFLHS